MSRHRARIKKAEEQLQPKSPPKIIVIWPGQEPPPEEPGENRIIFRVVYQDRPSHGAMTSKAGQSEQKRAYGRLLQEPFLSR